MSNYYWTERSCERKATDQARRLSQLLGTILHSHFLSLMTHNGRTIYRGDGTHHHRRKRSWSHRQNQTCLPKARRRSTAVIRTTSLRRPRSVLSTRYG